MSFPRQHLLGLARLSAGEILDLLDRAERFWDAAGSSSSQVDPLPGLSVANLFLEPSTRTRCSFEIAEARLGIERVSLVESAALSLVKGETLLDTARTLAAMGVNVFVVRHPEVGAPAAIADGVPQIHVINAGDGAGEHPTQGLLDLFVLRRRWGDLTGRRVLIVGDVAHSRVARSAYHGLTALGASVVLCGPRRWLPAATEYPRASLADDLDEALQGCDAVMALRVQRERLGKDEEVPDPAAYRRRFGLTVERADRLAPTLPVLHPGPFNRGVEIDDEVADGSRSLIWSQVRAGLAVRMAVLAALAEQRAAGSGRAG